MRGDDADKLGLEELVTIEEDVVAEPSTGGGDDAGAEVVKGQAEGLDVVTGDIGLLLGRIQLLRGQWHLVVTVVHEPEGADGWDSEGDTEGVLGREQGVGRVAGAVVEDDEQEDEDDLVEELSPTLHQEGGGDLAATVQTILTGGHLAGAHGVLHGGGGGHGVLPTNTDTVEEEGPGVADHPAIQVGAPGSHKHEQTEEHDGGVLDQTPAATDTGGN